MKITKDNYFSKEASKEFMGVTQFKSFVYGCEAKQVAKLNDKWEDAHNPNFLLGSYVHAYVEGELDDFKRKNPQLFYKADREKPLAERKMLKQYKLGDKMVDALNRFPVINEYLTGIKEEIITFDLFGVKWKSAIDVLNIEQGFFTDLKTTRDIQAKDWNREFTSKVPFFMKWDYLLQMAVYQKGVEIAYGQKLNPYIVAVDKNDTPDVILLDMQDDEVFEKKLEFVKQHIKRIQGLKLGIVEPKRCGECDYCKSTKTIDKPVSYKELL